MDELELPPQQRDIFYSTVWKIVRQVPSGVVTTYGQVAALIPCPEGLSPEDFAAFRARWVGQAMAACPADVPWQRVINSQGKISARRGAENQRRILEQEGVRFDAKEKIDLKVFGWDGPSSEWLQENHLLDAGGPKQLSLL